MHHTRIAAFLLGALLLGSVFMAFVATENFQTVSRILQSPPPESVASATLTLDSLTNVLSVPPRQAGCQLGHWRSNVGTPACRHVTLAAWLVVPVPYLAGTRLG